MIDVYDKRIFPLIRDLFAEQDNITTEEALITYSDEKLVAIRRGDMQLFKQWAQLANERAQAQS